MGIIMPIAINNPAEESLKTDSDARPIFKKIPPWFLFFEYSD